MSHFHESIRDLLAEVGCFINEDLQDAKLSKAQALSKETIVGRLKHFLDEYPNLRPKDRGSEKEDDMATTSSGGSSDSVDGTCPPIPAIALKPRLAGWLNKKRKPGGVKSKLGPQKRWCCIKDGYFYYYLNDTANKPQGRFHLEGYQLYTQFIGKELHLDLVCPERRKYEFETPDKHLFDYWITGIKEGVKARGTSNTDDITDFPTSDEIYDDIECESPVPKVNRPKPPTPPYPEETYDDITIASTGYPQLPSDDEDYEDAVSIIPPDDIYDDTIISSSVYPSQADIFRNKLSPQPISTPPVFPKSEVAAAGPSAVAIQQPPCPPTKPKKLAPTMITPRTGDVPLPSAQTSRDLKANLVETLYFSRWDYTGQNNDELSVNRGDVVNIIDKTFDKGSWWTGECNGSVGLIPKNYLVPVYKETGR